MSCGNSDILALIDYFQNGTDLSSNSWDNYNYYDLWNAIENGATPPNRTVCATFVQADIRSIVFAVLGVFNSPSDYLGNNIDFYYLYLKAIGQEVVSPSFGNFCIGQLYNLFSIGLTAKFRQGQNFECTMSKVAAIASITFEQGQQLDALLSKSAALQNAVFEQQQTFNAELAAGFTGLLDNYSGAVAAYSYRLLDSTYSGALCQIRRSSDNAIKDFYPDGDNVLSLTSEDGSGTSLSTWIGSDDGFVRTWYDQSGNSNNLFTGTSSEQAQLITTGVVNLWKSRAAMKFISANNMHYDATWDTRTGDEQFYLAGENLGDTGNAAIQFRSVYFWRDNTTRFRITSSGNQYLSTGEPTDGLLVVSMLTNDVDGWLNNSLAGESGSTTTSYNTTVIFGTQGLGSYMNNYVSEFVVWGNTADRTGKQDNINSFYNDIY